VKITKFLLFVAFVGLLCSASAQNFELYKVLNTFNIGTLSEINMNPTAINMVSISPDAESIQQAVDEITVKGTIYFKLGRYSKPGDYDVNITGKDITFVALDDGVIVDAGEKGRLFNIDKDSKVSMEKLSLHNGKVHGDGACINNAGDLNIINCNVSNNHAYKVDNLGYAGAIYNTGNCKINNSFISSNEADNNGGAIANFGTCTVANSELTNMTSYNNGGVFYNTGNFTVFNTNIYKNTAYKNGGIICNNGNFTSIATEFSKSVATKNYYDDYELLGGGVLYNNGSSTIVNSTLKNCSIRYNAKGSQVGGGAIVSDNGSVLNISGSFLDNHRNIAVVVLYNSKFNIEYSTVQNSDGAFSLKSPTVVKGCKFINNTAASKEENSNGGAINSVADVDIVDSVFDNNVAGSGGSIYNTATLNIVNSNFTGNNATAGGYYYGGGGAIKNLGLLTIRDSFFTNNTAKDNSNIRGGAIASSNDTEIRNSCFVNNTAKGSAGAVKIWNSCKYVITDSYFENNSASEFGGAIDFDNLISRPNYISDPGVSQGNNYNASLINTIFRNNHARWGGAVEAYGGITEAVEEIETHNCKFTNNSASDRGGAIDIHSNAEFKIILKGDMNHFDDYFISNRGSHGEDIYIGFGASFGPKSLYDEGKSEGRIIGGVN
jgi:predicted outer membrane repeat protein